MRTMSLCVGIVWTAVVIATADTTDQPAAHVNASIEAARREAQGTHAVVEAMLHAVHHHYYREGERLPLPAAVFREMFGKLAEERGVTLRWLAVEGAAMNVDHRPRDDFEREAVRVFLAGDDAFERVEPGSYRRAATIALTNQCLKCHVPDRKTLEDRSAGLVITVPLARLREDKPAAVPTNVQRNSDAKVK